MANRINEIVERRDINAKHYLLDNGKIEAEIFSYPVHYKNENDEFEDIDLSIIPNQQWETEYAVKKNNYRAYFNDSSSIENYTLASFEVENSNGVTRWINYKLFGATPTGHSYNDNKFKYYNVFDNVDLEYVVDHKKLKENIIIKQPVDSFSFTFSLKLSEGLVMQKQDNREIHFIDDDTNEVLWIIQSPYAYDAEYDGNATIFDENGNIIKKCLTKNINYTFDKVIYNGIEYDSITITLEDDEFLDNAVYPVVIDPTTVYPTLYCDTYVRGTSGYPNAQYMGIYKSDFVVETSYIRYFVADSIPSGVTILGGELKLYGYGYPVGNANLYSVSQKYVLPSITGDNCPRLQYFIDSVVLPFPGQGFVTFDIDAHYLDPNVPDNDKGWGIRRADNGEGQFATSENDDSSIRPQLKVIYEIPNKNPTASLVSYNGSSTSPTKTTDITPTLDWNFSDPDGDRQSTYRVYVYEYPAGTLVYDSGTVSSTATLKTVPEGVLEYRKTYRWRVYVTDGRGGGAYSTYGYFYIEIPPIGTAKIRINGVDIEFPIYNPNESVMAGKNQLRCNIGGVVGCFELVDVTDAKASAVRIKTASGVKAIRLQ